MYESWQVDHNNADMLLLLLWLGVGRPKGLPVLGLGYLYLDGRMCPCLDMCRFVDRAKCSRYAGGEDLGCMKAVLVQGGGVSVSRCLPIGSMITVSES